MAYSDPIKPVSSRYGAPMGRRTGPAYLCSAAGRVHLRRVPLDAGGYDRGGAYWGAGQALWCAQDRHGNTVILRASTREACRAKLRDMFGALRFFR